MDSWLVGVESMRDVESVRGVKTVLREKNAKFSRAGSRIRKKLIRADSINRDERTERKKKKEMTKRKQGRVRRETPSKFVRRSLWK